jgi:hypothetical protein
MLIETYGSQPTFSCQASERRRKTTKAQLDPRTMQAGKWREKHVPGMRPRQRQGYSI